MRIATTAMAKITQNAISSIATVSGIRTGGFDVRRDSRAVRPVRVIAAVGTGDADHPDWKRLMQRRIAMADVHVL
jgi:hypothetical protein